MMGTAATVKSRQFEEEILLTKNLKAFYGQQEILHDINVNFRKNTVTSLIGPSGAGKTTFLNALNRLNERKTTITGKIFYHGLDINGPEIDVYKLRTHIGMLFQEAHVFEMSIYDNIAFPLKCHGIKDESKLRQIIEESLTKAGLWKKVKDKLKQSARLLSKSQAQQLCLARALALEPEVLLLDEATSLLDPVATNTVENVLRTLKKKTTVIWITHNLSQAARISDDTVFFDKGVLVEKGRTKEVFTYPKSVRTDNYLSHNLRR
ncbi:phosphate ABC transporter ATP-binding protein [Liquorilactobacillus uvarum]|uniref:phosphate ABC transporter ATP-binding protein n=1 Tax=Liquorilactobacillus uvarum TaxID=303240 RepID=UPI002889D27D|nr:phosphate ABC transporter ATP-binding protein [Liquorilactobacillus uvarum]